MLPDLESPDKRGRTYGRILNFKYGSEPLVLASIDQRREMASCSFAHDGTDVIPYRVDRYANRQAIDNTRQLLAETKIATAEKSESIAA